MNSLTLAHVLSRFSSTINPLSSAPASEKGRSLVGAFFLSSRFKHFRSKIEDLEAHFEFTS